MPEYQYKCQQCQQEYKIVHSIKLVETQCKSCGGTLKRVPLLNSICINKTNNVNVEFIKPEVGSVVKEEIQYNKKLVEQYKEEMSNRIYDPNEEEQE